MNSVFNTVLRVVLPTSILSVEHHLLLKSIRIHQVARWTSIFGVSEVVFYREPDTPIEEFEEHKKLILDHWKYFFTPPYLRKHLVPLKPTLKYVGMLSPIRLEVFNVSRKPRIGELRIGYIYIENNKLKALIGDKLPYTPINECREKEFNLVRVVDVEKRLVECTNQFVYTGPRLSFSNSLYRALEESRRISRFIVATDRKGKIVSREEVEKIRGSTTTILFGSPKYDLFEISEQEGIDLSKFIDYTWNTVPGQKVVSVRTEEALIITLGVVNAFLRAV